ncbi:MAG: diacylglycerol kinase family protein [Chitinophagales bacterium]
MSPLEKEKKRFADAFNGILVFFREGEHAKFELFFSLLVITAGFYFDVTKTEWLVIILCIGFVLTAEALNTAVELLGDHVQKEKHPEMRNIKDVAAGAVFLAASAAAAAGFVIFIPYILKL